ncbi:orphan sodium- and chloride-dependent neurotransmitter transporter NTT5 [Meriones unguiculatus]|uniref:orphan sodium- and chloride-dependent neurotransmitter transporter NTT5 n=1 Tax=Meriones unguiculatus TaxID=10047 RepID=UPI00293EE003|nr:orphan sodium- and chloride-dependent neurotransmitter transporter NTT5 [Meriones unguiculatus]
MTSRSTKKGGSTPSQTKPSASLEDVPSGSSLTKSLKSFQGKKLPTERLSMLSSLTTWSESAWVAEAKVSKSRMAKAQAWETLALEAQARGGIQPKSSPIEEATVTIVTQESSEDMTKINKEDSDDFTPRPLWSSKVEYILALMGYLMNPGRLWRFVSRCLHKGGCNFLIAYILLLLCVGIPLLFLEMAVGQRAQQSSMDLWKTLGPWFGGIGYSMFLVCFIANTFTNLFNSWILFYMSHMFYFVFPWEKCPLQRNSSNFDPECERATSYTYFWYRKTLKASDSIEDGGSPAFSLSMFLFVAWCLICVFMVNGMKSIGKVLYVLVLLPYFIITCFLFRTLTLEGSEQGLKHLLILKVASIYDLTMWSQAGTQVMFDMGLGFGPIVSLASHMPDFNNCLHDAFLMAVIKILTLLFITPFILSVLSFWATITTHRCCKRNAEAIIMLIAHGILPPEAQPPDLQDNPTFTYHSWLSSLPQPLKRAVASKVPVCNVQEKLLKIEESPQFVLLIFTEVISLFPGSAFWTVFCFLLLLSLGLCAALMLTLGVIIPLQDTFSFCRRQPRILTVGASMVLFLCSLFFLQPSGIYYFSLLSEYWIVLPTISIIICETLAVAWAYGAKRFLADMMALLSCSIFLGCDWLWRYVSPAVLLGLFVAFFIQLCRGPIYMAWDSRTSKEVVRRYPVWCLILLAGLSVFVFMPIPAYFAYCLVMGIPFRPVASPKLSVGSGQSLTKKESSKAVP